ncbi:transcriptional regulator [Microbacterium sp. gxy059]|uniref:transcriptional regulator n=1 Tax=Microbacterium sp. gxy059 TaxID=2957199 RepID=UPI003D99691B
MSENRVRRPLMLTAAALSGALLLAGCGASAEEEPVTEEAPVEETAPEEEAPVEEEPEEEAAAPAGDQTEVEIGETIEDPDMGDTIQVVSAIRDFPSEAEADLIAEGGEVVLVQVEVTTGDEFGGLVSAGDLEISWDEGADFWNNKTRMIADEMEAAGYEVFDDVSRRDGGATGWIGYLVDERADSYQLKYHRSGAEVIGSDEVIDAFDAELVIPAP